MILKLKNVRIAFPEIHAPKAMAGEAPDKAAYSAAFLLPPDHPQLPAIRKAIEEAGAKKFGAKWPSVKVQAEALGKICLKDGNLKPDYQGYPGNFFVNARRKGTDPKPVVCDETNVRIDGTVDKCKAGDYVNANIEIYGYDGKAKGVAAGLRAVQFVKFGDRFGGSAPLVADGEFEDLTVGASSDEEFA
jgi:hypothetical protein